MRNFKRKWLSSALALLLVVCMFASSIPLPSFAQQADETEQLQETDASDQETQNSPAIRQHLSSDGETTIIDNCFAITTEIEGAGTWALGCRDRYGRHFGLVPYDKTQIEQMWIIDEYGKLQWLPHYFDHSDTFESWDFYLSFSGIIAPDNPDKLLEKSESLRTDSHLQYEVKYEEQEDGYHYSGSVPLVLDGLNPEEFHLKIYDPENKLSAIPLQLDDHLRVALDQGDLDRLLGGATGFPYGVVPLDVLSIFQGTSQSDAEELHFRKEMVQFEYPHFVDYKMEEDDWKITYNPDGSYNVEVTGRLNVPLRKADTAQMTLWTDDSVRYAEAKIAPGETEFTIRAEGLPDDLETHFWFELDQIFLGPASGPIWRLGPYGNYSIAKWELHEETTNIPVEKIWDDDRDHSGDTVELCLVENERETAYRVTLGEPDKQEPWKGAFRHVPHVRWEYPIYVPVPVSLDDTPGRDGNDAWDRYGRDRIPLPPHEYTIKELNVKPGYIPIYSWKELEKEEPEWLKPGKSPSVQAVYVPNDGSTLLAAELVTGLGEYAPKAKEQQFFLNGNMLIAKIEEDFVPFPIYIHCYFEKAEEGKYNLYMLDPSGERHYLAADDASDPTDKSMALPFEFRDFETGETLETLPTDSFQPVTKLIQIYENGQGTDWVCDLNQFGVIDAPGSFIAQYDPNSQSQKFTVCCCEEQFVVVSDKMGADFSLLLEPCEGAPGQYLLRVPYLDSVTYEYMLNYVGREQENETPTLVKEKEKALHFVLTDNATQKENTFGKVFTVTNVLTASLEVSKTVSGEGADPDKQFTFTVTLGDTSVNGTYGDMEFTDGVATFTLKHGEKKTGKGLPKGITYEVVETDNAGYTVTVNGDAAADGKASGTLIGGETVTLAFNNDKPVPPTEPSEPTTPSEPTEPSEPTTPSEPTEPSEPTNPDVPATGDSSNMALWFAIMASAAVGLIVLLFARKKVGRSVE